MSDTYVLIHGAWHTGELLEPTAQYIRQKGHTVHCPTLKGNRPGDDRSQIGLEDAAQAVRELLHSSSDPPCAASPRLHGHDVGPALDRAVGPHAGTGLVVGHAEFARHAVLAAALGRRRG